MGSRHPVARSGDLAPHPDAGDRARLARSRRHPCRCRSRSGALRSHASRRRTHAPGQRLPRRQPALRGRRRGLRRHDRQRRGPARERPAHRRAAGTGVARLDESVWPAVPPERALRSSERTARRAMKPMYSAEWFETFAATVPTAFVAADLDGITDMLPPERYTRILDVGCGIGRIAGALSSRGYAVTGLDISVEALLLASQHAPG